MTGDRACDVVDFGGAREVIERSTHALGRYFSNRASSWERFSKAPKTGAGNRVRTGDIQLGKLALYQLSYSREKTETGIAQKKSARVKSSTRVDRY